MNDMSSNHSLPPHNQRPSSEEHFAETRSWAWDRAEAQERATRKAWIVAGVATGIAALEALALIALAPLKTVVPYTVLVDRATGYTVTLDGTHPQVAKPDSALTQSLLAQYVIAREGFDLAAVGETYRKVALWSGQSAKADYLALMPASNPLSPLSLYPRSTLVSVAVESVSMSGPDTARVRFLTERRDAGQGAVTRAWYVAELSWRFSGEPLSAEDRLANPLGFQVLRYRRDQEALPQTLADSAPPLAQGAPAPAQASAMVPGPMGAAAPGAYTSPAEPRAAQGPAPIGPRAPRRQGLR